MTAPTLLAGTYERFLFGFRVPQDALDAPGAAPQASGGAQIALPESFAYAPHMGPVKCVASAGNYVATGGTDDMIRIYDIKHGKDLGQLVQHEGTVTSLSFFGPAYQPTHLLSGGEDGCVNIWRARKGWDHLKAMRGHKGAINGITVHPTGRLALSVGQDRSLRMWNLIKGRCTYNHKVPTEPELVRFNPVGLHYSVSSGPKVEVYTVEVTGEPMAILEHERRVTALAQCADHVLLTTCEGGSLSAWDTRASARALEVPKAHTARIRGLALPGSDEAEEGGGGALPPLVATASSDGVVRLWDPRATAAPLGEGRAGGSAKRPGARITCLCATGPAYSGPTMDSEDEEESDGERQEGEESEDESEDEEEKAPPAKRGRAGGGRGGGRGAPVGGRGGGRGGRKDGGKPGGGKGGSVGGAKGGGKGGGKSPGVGGPKGDGKSGGKVKVSGAKGGKGGGADGGKLQAGGAKGGLDYSKLTKKRKGV